MRPTPRKNRWNKATTEPALEVEPIPGEDATERAGAVVVKTLIELTSDSLNGLGDTVEEWDEVEFMVDSGAGTTVIGLENVKSVQASKPDPNKSYRMANGDVIEQMDQKVFHAVAEDEQLRRITAQVTEVDEPLLSVHQIVKHGSSVVFAPSGS